MRRFPFYFPFLLSFTIRFSSFYSSLFTFFEEIYYKLEANCSFTFKNEQRKRKWKWKGGRERKLEETRWKLRGSPLIPRLSTILLWIKVNVYIHSA